MTSSDTTLTASPTPVSRLPRNAWLVAGGLGLTALGMAAGMAMKSAPSVSPTATPVALSAPAAGLADDGKRVVEAGPLVDDPAPDAKRAAPAAEPGAAPQAARTTPRHAARSGTSHAALPTQRAAACSTCGVVETVRAVQVKGEGTGIGAVAGGVLGGVVGNQVGGGNGRKAMTVIGAVGGGLAGHEIEKRARSETVYKVSVRMEDGSLRTFTQSSAPAAGSRVVVDGGKLRAASSARPAPEMMRTSTGA